MDWKRKDRARFVEAIVSLETPEETRRFLRDVMTEREIDECANRLRAAEMLAKKIPYVRVEEETGLSSATVARVAKWLNGNEGGYRLVIEKASHHTPASSRRGLS